VSRIFTVAFSSVYPHYVAEVEKKGRTHDQADQVICWLTGLDQATLQRHRRETTVEEFFARAHLMATTGNSVVRSGGPVHHEVAWGRIADEAAAAGRAATVGRGHRSGRGDRV
jgi:hypothetical protein